MGGAATAAPLDAVGAIHWNPASISGLPESSVEIGMELLASRHTAASSVAGGAFGPGFPPVDLQGSTDSEVGVSMLPSIGVIYKPYEYLPRWSFGLGVTAIGGFYTNFAASTTNPLFTAPPPAGAGIGAVYGRLGLLQVAPTIAYWVTDTVAIGAAPTITYADLQADPAGFAGPDDAGAMVSQAFPRRRKTVPCGAADFKLAFSARPPRA
jgi:long-chain fatty acid transport protein